MSLSQTSASLAILSTRAVQAVLREWGVRGVFTSSMRLEDVVDAVEEALR